MKELNKLSEEEERVIVRKGTEDHFPGNTTSISIRDIIFARDATTLCLKAMISSGCHAVGRVSTKR